MTVRKCPKPTFPIWLPKIGHILHLSRHLAILRDAGLVIAERNGQEIYYELNASIFEDLIKHLMTWTKKV